MKNEISTVTKAAINIPVQPDAGIERIAPESGIVGVAHGNKEEEGCVLYYEGNLYKAGNIREYKKHVSCAAGRLSLATQS